MEEGTKTPIREDASIRPLTRFVFQPRPVEDEAMRKGRGSQAQAAVTSKTELPAIQPLYVSSIQTFETCGYFSGSYKRTYPTKDNSHKLVLLNDGRPIKIITNLEYGYANALDLDFKRALFRIIDEQAERVERFNPDGTKTYHYRIPQQPLRVETSRMIRLAGHKKNSRIVKDLRNFFARNQDASMEGKFEDPKTGEFVDHKVSLFAEVVTIGKKTKDGQEADRHLVWLTPYALRLYYWHRTRQEDINFHNQLTQAYAKVLYPYLDSGWYASFKRGGQE